MLLWWPGAAILWVEAGAESGSRTEALCKLAGGFTSVAGSTRVGCWRERRGSPACPRGRTGAGVHGGSPGRRTLQPHGSLWFRVLLSQCPKRAGCSQEARASTEVGTCLSSFFSFTMTPVAHRYKSNEEYVYVRGRGRGKYVCEECGIRCKKPSMLKKHIRTHTDVRPYVCKHCHFAFKTKGKR